MPGNCSYNKIWSQTYPWAKPVKQNNGRAFCTVCAIDFDIKSMGVSRLQKHQETVGHKKLAAELRSIPQLPFYSSGASNQADPSRLGLKFQIILYANRKTLV